MKIEKHDTIILSGYLRAVLLLFSCKRNQPWPYRFSYNCDFIYYVENIDKKIVGAFL